MDCDTYLENCKVYTVVNLYQFWVEILSSANWYPIIRSISNFSLGHVN